MLSRVSVPATVGIDISRSYDTATREFNATVDFTALQTLNGEFKFNVILLEDGIVWPQAGSLGGPNYVHDWTVRAMMNGALGEQIINGTWNQGQVVTRTVNYTYPVPPSPAPDIVPDSCRIAVLVYKVGSPLNSNGEIQQAEHWPLLSPDYVAFLNSPEQDFLGNSDETAQYTVVLRNEGLMDDSYAVSLNFAGPAGWQQTFTTVNGSFTTGETDTIAVTTGDSTIITVNVNANSIQGYGVSTLDFQSLNYAANAGEIDLRFATFGLDVLVVDDDGNKPYESYCLEKLDSLQVNYGCVSSSVIPAATANLNSFGSLIWMCALSDPTLDPQEMSAISTYLDNGGSIYLNGVDISYHLADPGSPYYTQNSLDFFTNYLHASYVRRYNTFLMVEGISGDPITGGIGRMGLTGGTGASTIDFQTGKYAGEIDVADTNAVPMLHFITRPNQYSGIRSIHQGSNGTGRVVYTTFGFETIAEDTNRALFAEKVLDWLDVPTGLKDSRPVQTISTFVLKPNYPNPFNPTTRIAYQLPVLNGDKIATLVVYNQLGQVVKTLVNKAQLGGSYEANWDGRDDARRRVASGIYFYQLRYGDYQATRKMILLR